MATRYIPFTVVIGLLLPFTAYARSPESFTDVWPYGEIIIALIILTIFLFLIGLVVACWRRSGRGKKQEYLWHGKETDWKLV